ncbi:ribonuclease T2-like protein [Dactylonectria estremocensis]|uniref:ribonuclease T2 n=1 Tax=Dactylonectria estremocensis TaxID=1079267 RepID=A0A9P9J4Y6_9HYPO|nr:ribonuclease T2-like protein [Dactylonectria estremocensis]
MAYLQALIPVVAALAGTEAASNFSCPSNIPLSCHNTTAVSNTCCFIPAGQILQTQFWDTDPVAGPSDSWTIHGLWPDNCDGTYPQFCDSSREYTDIRGILTKFGDDDILSYIDTYWVSDDGNDESLWEHEFSKHGTCISTLEPSCYNNYKTGQEVVDYVNTLVSLFQKLPTFDWLEEAGIEPSDSKTYTSSEIQAALEAQHGAAVTLGCSGSNLNEVWYHFNIKGSLQEGKFVAAAPDGSKSSCPSTGVKYAPKS